MYIPDICHCWFIIHNGCNKYLPVKYCLKYCHNLLTNINCCAMLYGTRGGRSDVVVIVCVPTGSHKTSNSFDKTWCQRYHGRSCYIRTRPYLCQFSVDAWRPTSSVIPSLTKFCEVTNPLLVIFQSCYLFTILSKFFLFLDSSQSK